MSREGGEADASRTAVVALVVVVCYAWLLVAPSALFPATDRARVPGGAPVCRPLASLDLAIDGALAGESPRWHHLRSGAWHLLAAILVLRLLGRWGLPATAAMLGAIVFAVHPVQVEAVARTAGRGDLLCTVLVLTALLLHGRSRGLDLRFAGSVVALAAALLSGPGALAFPVVAALADLFFRDGCRPGRTLRRWPRYLAYAIVAGLVLVVAPPVRLPPDPAVALLTVPRSIVYLLRLVVLPVDMAADFFLRPATSLDPLTLACAAGVLAVVAWASVRAIRGGGAAAFAILWAFVLLLPVTALSDLRPATSERMLSLPMVGVAVPVGAALSRASARLPPGRWIVALLLLCLLAVSVDRTLDWRSEDSLRAASLRRCDDPVALGYRADRRTACGERLRNEAQKLMDEGEEEKASERIERAYANLDGAIRDCGRAIGLWARIPGPAAAISVVRSKRALARFERGYVRLAFVEADEVLEDPSEEAIGRAHLVRSLALDRMGDFRAAARAGEKALEHDDRPKTRRRVAAIYRDLARWYNQPAWRNRALTLGALRRSRELLPDPSVNGEVVEAIEEMEREYEAALRWLQKELARSPECAEVLLNLAVLHARHGNYEEAEPVFRYLLGPARLGRDPRVLFPFARYFWESRDTVRGYDEAERIYREISASAPDFPGVREALDRLRGERGLLLRSLGR